MTASAQAAIDTNPAPAWLSARAHTRRRLVDGTDVVIRPIRPADYAIEMAFVRGLSRDAAYNRLLSARRLTRQEIRQLTHIDYDREMAFVAVAGDGEKPRLLGVARYVRDAAAGSAEFAIVVADAWQRKGVGSLLLGDLLDYAGSVGIRRLHGITLATNQAMQKLAYKYGFVKRNDRQDASVRLLERKLDVDGSPIVAKVAGEPARPAANDETTQATDSTSNQG